MLVGPARASFRKPTCSSGGGQGLALRYQARGLKLASSEVPGGETAAKKEPVLILLLDPD